MKRIRTAMEAAGKEISMNWEQEAVNKLKEYEAKKQASLGIPQELAQLEAEARQIRSSLEGGGHGREDALLRNLAHRQELSWALEQVRKQVARLESALEVMSSEERLVLDRFYIHPMRGNLDRLCEELALEKSAVYDRRDKARRHFAIAMYGAVES